MFNKWISFINVLNISLRYEGAVVTSPSVLNTDGEKWVADNIIKIPGYTMLNAYKLDKTGC
jgi:hypothetical protein